MFYEPRNEKNGKKSATSKKLSFMSIYFLGINGVIGSGAFLLPQTIYKDMNLMSVSVFVTICAAVTVSMVALCYADLSSRFTGSGAAWLYSYNAFGRFTGYELGIYTWFLGCCTYAAEVVALLTTLKSFWPVYNNAVVYYGTAIGLIILFTIINFLVSCIVLASFVQYVPSILAVIKFKHTNEFPNHGFKFPGGYTIPILALLISCYMVTNFTWKTILVGVVVGVLAAVAYFFIEKDEKAEQKHQQYLAKMRQK